MKRKITAAVLAVSCVFLFSSCGAKTDAVTDSNGKQITIKRDKNGFAQTDKEGNLIVYDTVENGKIKQTADGEDVTSVIDFPNYIFNEKTVECESFIVKIPEGWEVQKGHTVKLLKEESQAEVSFTLRSTDSVDECLDQIKDLFSEWDADWQESEVDFGFAKAKVISSSKIIDHYEKSYYVFAVDSASYVVSTSFNKKLAESVDFSEVIGKMTFK